MIEWDISGLWPSVATGKGPSGVEGALVNERITEEGIYGAVVFPAEIFFTKLIAREDDRRCKIKVIQRIWGFLEIAIDRIKGTARLFPQRLCGLIPSRRGLVLNIDLIRELRIPLQYLRHNVRSHANVRARKRFLLRKGGLLEIGSHVRCRKIEGDQSRTWWDSPLREVTGSIERRSKSGGSIWRIVSAHPIPRGACSSIESIGCYHHKVEEHTMGDDFSSEFWYSLVESCSNYNLVQGKCGN